MPHFTRTVAKVINMLLKVFVHYLMNIVKGRPIFIFSSALFALRLSSLGRLAEFIRRRVQSLRKASKDPRLMAQDAPF